MTTGKLIHVPTVDFPGSHQNSLDVSSSIILLKGKVWKEIKIMLQSQIPYNNEYNIPKQ